MLCQLLNYPLSCMEGFEHSNLCLYKLEFTGTVFTVKNFLDVSHLQERAKCFSRRAAELIALSGYCVTSVV